MTQTADIVIVGGGIVGCAIAYYLGLHPVGRVLLLEHHVLSEANTGRGAGLLSRMQAKPQLITLVQETYRALDRLEDERGEPVGLRRVGAMHAADSAEGRTALHGAMRVARQAGLRVQSMTPEDAMRRAPWLRLDTAEIAFLPDEGFIDPYVLTHAYAQAARRRKVEIREGTGVLRIRRLGDRVTGLLTDHGFIATGLVIDTTGILTGILARQGGAPIQMSPVQMQYWVTRENEGFLHSQPMVHLNEFGFYARPERGGLLFGMIGAQPDGLDPRVFPARSSPFNDSRADDGWPSLVWAVPHLRRFFPDVGNVSIDRYVSGHSVDTPDGAPVLGALPGLTGFLGVAGNTTISVAASGGIGLALADLAAGRPPFVDLTPFSASRFVPGPVARPPAATIAPPPDGVCHRIAPISNYEYRIGTPPRSGNSHFVIRNSQFVICFIRCSLCPSSFR